MSTRWYFVEHGNGPPGWTWRRVEHDASEIVSTRSFREFGLAVHDAIVHGFRPATDQWMTITNVGTTYYRPDGKHGATPERFQAINPRETALPEGSG